jgi:hypothetical protein
MAEYLMPITHNNKVNDIVNSSDFNYQNSYLTYYIADIRYVLKSTYTSTIATINESITYLQNEINSVNVNEWVKLIKQPIDLSGQNTIINSLFYGDIDMNNNNISMKSRGITEYSNSQNTFGKSTFINDVIVSNLNQTSGSSVLLDTNMGTLTQGINKYITH